MAVLWLWSLSVEASQLSVVSYNVWFDYSTAKQRIPQLLNIVASKNADIIAFQEVESWFIEALEKDTRFKNYYFSVERGWFNSVKGGLLILIKSQVLTQEYLSLPSKMERGSLHIMTEVEGIQLCIATTHLESMLNDTQIRIKQLKLILEKNAPCQHSILLGDFNFGNGEPENKLIKLDYIDVWKHLKPEKSGYTWNVERSNLARKNSFPSEGSRRLDKIYVKGKKFFLKKIAIIGNTPFKTQSGNRLFPSDHFGLAAIFGFKN